MFEELQSKDILRVLDGYPNSKSDNNFYCIWYQRNLFPAKEVVRKALEIKKIRFRKTFNTDEAQNRLLKLGFPIYDPKDEVNDLFFTQKDLTTFKSLVQRNSYDPDDKLDKNIGQYLYSVSWEKTKIWAELLNEKGWHINGYKNWNVRSNLSGQKYKDYTWWKIYPPKTKHTLIFFTVGIGAGGDLVYKLDCKVNDPFFRESENRDYFDNLKSELNIGWQIISTKEIEKYDWNRLVTKSDNYFNKHLDNYESISRKLDDLSKKRLMRLTWNENEWQFPSGHNWDEKDQGKKNVSFENQYGYGYEEWLLNPRYQKDGFQYGYIRGIEHLSDKQESLNEIILFTIHKDSTRFLVGNLKNVIIIEGDEDELEDISLLFKKYEHNVVEELKEVNAYYQFIRSVPLIPNIKFKLTDCLIYDSPLVIKELRGSKYNRFQPYYLNGYFLNLSDKKYDDRNKLLFKAGRGKTVEEYNTKTSKSNKSVRKHHTTISNDLYKYLNKSFPKYCLSEEETKIGSKTVDFALQEGNSLTLFEIKTHSAGLLNIREAIGQILEYALLDPTAKIKRLIMVGPAELTSEEVSFLKSLQKIIAKPLEYWSYSFNERLIKNKFSQYDSK